MFLEAVDWCEEIGVNYYKIRYKDNQNKELIQKIIKTKKPFFISSNENIPKSYLDPLFYPKQLLKNQINLLCIPSYPTKLKEYKKKNIAYYQGYSDHTENLKLLKIILNKGMQYFEKHMKLNNTQPLEDAWSVSFAELEAIL